MWREQAGSTAARWWSPTNVPSVLFVIHAIDRPNSLELRKATRPAHLEFLAGFDTPVGGPLLDADGAMCGSCVILDVPDRAAADAFVENDPYAKAGLFESVTVHEFMKVSWP
jgi:uncharacterized protein YciI